MVTTAPATAHFAYYLYAKRWLEQPWAKPLIEAKLEDIARQGYLPDKFQNMVADSALTEDIPDKPQHNHQHPTHQDSKKIHTTATTH
jgi:hypothetical protein